MELRRSGLFGRVPLSMKKLYLYVTKDEYELPLVVEETATALAGKVGTTPDAVYSGISHELRGGPRSRFKKVEVEEEDGS